MELCPYRLSRHQLNEHFLEARQIEVDLCVDQSNAGGGLQCFGPGKGVAVAGAVTQVDVHVDEHGGVTVAPGGVQRPAAPLLGQPDRADSRQFAGKFARGRPCAGREPDDSRRRQADQSV